MRRFKSLHLAMLTLGSLCLNSAYASDTLHSLSDSEMSATTGQALMSLSYISPKDTANLEALRTNNTDPNSGGIGFYRLGLEAELELNANIRRLQLGCGGVNNGIRNDVCDIDIENLSLSGLTTNADGSPMTREQRASSSAKITNPFIEFAIKNPGKASTREVVGLRLSAEKLQGLLTTGTENSSTPNGIKSISGFMRVQSDSSGYVYGKASTMARDFYAIPNASYVIDGETQIFDLAVSGKVKVTGLGFLGGAIAPITFKTTDGGFKVPQMDNVPFIRPTVIVNKTRATSLDLQATLAVPNIRVSWNQGESGSWNYPEKGTVLYGCAGSQDGTCRDDETTYPKTVSPGKIEPRYSPINWTAAPPSEVQTRGGKLTAVITDCGGLGCLVTGNGKVLPSVYMQGEITGITGDVTIKQGLGYIHSLPIDSSDASSVPSYLSLQSQALRWPGTYSGPNPDKTNIYGITDTNAPNYVTDIAQPGWWLSVGSPINLGSVNPNDQIDVAKLFPQIKEQLQTFLMDENNAASLSVGQLGNVISGNGDVSVGVGSLPVTKPLTMTLYDLSLSGQGFNPNCYGNLKFC